MRLSCGRGEIEAEVGDRFQWDDGTWEIVGFRYDASYFQPEVPIVRMRLISGSPGEMLEDWMEGDETDWTGDSVANALLRFGIRLQ